jgi:hypothetical protein
VAPEEDREEHDAAERRDAETAAEEVADDQQEPAEQEEPRDQRVGKEADELLGEPEVHDDQFVVVESELGEQRVAVGDDSCGVADVERLRDRQREQLLVRHEALDLDPGIDHGRRDPRVSPVLLRGRLERGAHRRDRLLVGGLAVASHRCGRAEHRARRHVDLVRSDRDQRSGRVRRGVDQRDRSHVGVDDRVSHLDHRIEPAARGVDLDDDRGRPVVLGRVHHPFDVRRQPEIDRAADVHHVHRPGGPGVVLRGGRPRPGEHGEREHHDRQGPHEDPAPRASHLTSVGTRPRIAEFGRRRSSAHR